MKNIIFFSRRFGIGGAETFIMNVFESISKDKYNITLALANSAEQKDLYEEKAKQLGIKIIHINELNSFANHIKYIHNTYQLLKSSNYDVIHSNTGSFDGIILLLAKLAKIKTRICHAHTLQSQMNISSIPKKVLRNIYFKTMQKLMVTFSTDRIACSEQACNYSFGKSGGTVIYNGININKFQPVEQNKTNELIKKYIPQLPSKKHYIVSVGRVSFEKNVLFAIRTINELRKLRDDFCYIWVGDGEMLDEAKEKSHELALKDTVFFTGTRTDVPDILNCCDIFLLPSLFEGLPFSLIEAQYAGLQCFASTGVTELSNIGRTKYLDLESGEKNWAITINNCLGKKCPDLIEEKAKLFDIRYTVKQLEEIYDR